MNEEPIEALDLGTDELLSLSKGAAGRIFVDDERVWSISALADGIVALTTGIRTVHISATDYWRLLHGDARPSTREAGHLVAQLEHLRSHALELLDQLGSEGLIDPIRYPGVYETVTFLRTALGLPIEEEIAGQDEEMLRPA